MRNLIITFLSMILVALGVKLFVAKNAEKTEFIRHETLVNEAMECLGAGRHRILWRHIAPNILSPVLVQMTFNFASAIILEASLSFLGAGIPQPEPSWGGMLNEARSYLFKAWWMAAFPAAMTGISVLGFNLFGDGLRDLLDPMAGR